MRAALALPFVAAVLAGSGTAPIVPQGALVASDRAGRLVIVDASGRVLKAPVFLDDARLVALKKGHVKRLGRGRYFSVSG